MKNRCCLTALVIVIFCFPACSSGDGGQSNGTDGDTADSADAADGFTTGDVEDSELAETTGDTPDAGQRSDDKIYKGSFAAQVSLQAVDEIFAGKAAIKLREDGLFSGTGAGAKANGSLPFEIALSGTLVDDQISGQLIWTWADSNVGLQPTCTITGTLTDQGMQLSFQGGVQTEPYSGTLMLVLQD
jgi:hypothetical protein